MEQSAPPHPMWQKQRPWRQSPRPLQSLSSGVAQVSSPGSPHMKSSGGQPSVMSARMRGLHACSRGQDKGPVAGTGYACQAHAHAPIAWASTVLVYRLLSLLASGRRQEANRSPQGAADAARWCFRQFWVPQPGTRVPTVLARPQTAEETTRAALVKVGNVACGMV